MVDLTTPLGREVATPQQVLEVIRPELRIMRAHYRGVIEATLIGWLEATPDLELTDGGDQAADEAVFTALLDSAVKSVGQWARDMSLVYVGEALREFIRQALIDAMVTTNGEDPLPEGALDY